MTLLYAFKSQRLRTDDTRNLVFVLNIDMYVFFCTIFYSM